MATGSILGIMGACLAGRAMQNILFGIPAIHAPTMAGTAIILTIVSLAACLWPTLSARRVDPMEVLRHE